MTDYEAAMLRLKAWKAIEGWGAASASTDKRYVHWDWAQRMKYADELFAWMTKTATHE
jgi:hypothetical protein